MGVRVELSLYNLMNVEMMNHYIMLRTTGRRISWQDRPYRTDTW